MKLSEYKKDFQDTCEEYKKSTEKLLSLCILTLVLSAIITLVVSSLFINKMGQDNSSEPVGCENASAANPTDSISTVSATNIVEAAEPIDSIKTIVETDSINAIDEADSISSIVVTDSINAIDIKDSINTIVSTDSISYPEY